MYCSKCSDSGLIRNSVGKFCDCKAGRKRKAEALEKVRKHWADRLEASVPVDAVPVGRVEEDRYLILGATADEGLFMERDGVQYQARWVPVGGE